MRNIDEQLLSLGLAKKYVYKKNENKALNEMLKDQGSLPEGVYEYYGFQKEYYRVDKLFKDGDLEKALLMKQTIDIRTIKNIVVFFFVLYIIGLILKLSGVIGTSIFISNLF